MIEKQFSNMKSRLIIFIFIINLFFINFASAETIIYDNITVSQYKTIQIQDDLNVKYINDYTDAISLREEVLHIDVDRLGDSRSRRNQRLQGGTTKWDKILDLLYPY